MTIKSSGLISMADICTELGLSTSSPRSLNDSAIRTLLGKPSDPISLADAYGKSSVVGTNGGKFRFSFYNDSSGISYAYTSNVLSGGQGAGSSSPDPATIDGSNQIYNIGWSNNFGNPCLSLWLLNTTGSSVKMIINGRLYTLPYMSGSSGVYILYAVPNMLNSSDVFDISFSH